MLGNIKAAITEALLLEHYKAAAMGKKKPKPEPPIRRLPEPPHPIIMPLGPPPALPRPLGDRRPPWAQGPRGYNGPPLPPAGSVPVGPPRGISTPQRPPVRAPVRPPAVRPQPGVGRAPAVVAPVRPTGPINVNAELQKEIEAVDAERARLQAEIDALRLQVGGGGGGGSALPPTAVPTLTTTSNPRGTPNARGTYPYYRGHGPTKKFQHEQFQDYDAMMRRGYPEWYYGGGSGRAKPNPEMRWDSGEPIDWHDYVVFGGQPPMTATEERDRERREKQYWQQQRPDIYGRPGTPFKDPRQPGYRPPGGQAPQSRGGRPPAGYRPPNYTGPFGANQRALDDVLRLQQQVPVVVPGGAGTPPSGPRARRR